MAYIRLHKNRPLLVSYQSDHTKNRTAAVMSERVPGVGTARILSWATGDILIGRLFVSAGPYKSTGFSFDDVTNTGSFLVRKDYVCQNVAHLALTNSTPTPSCVQ